jgi:hypothetical protein
LQEGILTCGQATNSKRYFLISNFEDLKNDNIVKMKNKVFQSLMLVIGFLLIADITRAQENQPTAPDKKAAVQFPAANQFANSKLSYKIIPAANQTWSYDILADGKMMIHQPSVPGLPGKEGFKTKVAAQRVAELVIDKIKYGEMPPSITKEEMKKMGSL